MRRHHTSTQRIRNGVVFIKDHPQLYFTALVGTAILGAFLFMAFHFASIAKDAQEELQNVRIGSILDAFVLFAPDSLNDSDVMRERMRALMEQNPTIRSFTILAPHGTNWRVYLTHTGDGEGSVSSDTPIVYTLAFGDPRRAYTLEHTDGTERFFTTARAIANEGSVQALAVTTQSLSEADQRIANNIRNSFFVLIVVLVLILALFLRHARILDYATLYRKQREIDAMKDSFIGMASHELKSPLSVIRGYVEFLKDGTGDVAAQKEYLRRIDVSAEELKNLIDDILDVTRIEMGSMRFEPTAVVPHDILAEVVAMFTAQAQAKGLSLVLNDESARAPAVLVDPGRLKQVLVNLVSNAVKYSLAGTITVSAHSVDSMVEFSVRDRGVGMTAEQQAKLFSKFYRIESKDTKGVAGTGLGLWITKYIVEHMQGAISVESIQGEGSRFVVRFPQYHATEER